MRHKMRLPTVQHAVAGVEGNDGCAVEVHDSQAKEERQEEWVVGSKLDSTIGTRS